MKTIIRVLCKEVQHCCTSLHKTLMIEHYYISMSEWAVPIFSFYAGSLEICQNYKGDFVAGVADHKIYLSSQITFDNALS